MTKEWVVVIYNGWVFRVRDDFPERISFQYLFEGREWRGYNPSYSMSSELIKAMKDKAA